MRLFLAEKPSLARVIAKGLGGAKNEKGYIACNNDCIVASASGHLLELVEPDYYTSDSVPRNKNGKKIWRLEDLPILPSTLKKCISYGKKEQMQIIGNLLKKAQDVVVCGDADREGQLLIEEILEYFGWKGKTLRFWSQSTDDIAVKRALADLQPNEKYHSLALAAEGRSQADWFIGMNISRAETCAHNAGLITVGRVQTPVLRIVADRDLAIVNFKPKDFFNVEVEFTNTKGKYKGKWKIPEDYLDPEGYLTDKTKADEIVSKITGQKGTITSVTQKLKNQTPPIPFDLNKLQVECGKKFGFTPKRTLEIAQELYEKHSLTSYPRSSCGYLAQTQQSDVESILKNLQEAFPQYRETIQSADPKRKSPIWNDKKVAETSHTGIIPTLRAISAEEVAKLPEECRNVYELIAKRYIACFLQDLSWYETTVNTDVANESFITVGKKIINKGFKAFLTDTSNSEQDEILPPLQQGEIVSAEKCEIKTSVTKPPVSFTMLSIVEAMENCAKYVDDPKEKKLLKEGKGIGTVATRASILDLLVKRGFLTVTGKKQEIHCSPAASHLLEVVPKVLQSVSLTANAEDEMQRIQRGDASLNDFLNKQKEFVNSIVSEIKRKNENEIKKCPICGAKLYRNESKFNHGEFYFKCSNKDCGKYFHDVNGNVGEEIVKKEHSPGQECPACHKNEVVRCESKKKPGTFFWFCRACKQSFKDNAGAIGQKYVIGKICPCCEKKAVYRFEKKDHSGYYWRCMECKTFFEDINENGFKKSEKTTEQGTDEKCPACGQMTCRAYKNKSNDGQHWYCKSCHTSFKDDHGKVGAAFPSEK